MSTKPLAAARPSSLANTQETREQESSRDTLLTIYLASGFGAICLGLGDLLNNDKAATVLKLGEVMRRNIYPGLQSGGLLAMALLALLGAGVCWIHQPATRVDAFTRGFSVFAILAVVTPYQSPPLQQSAVATTTRDGEIATVREPNSTVALAAMQSPSPEETENSGRVPPEIDQAEPAGRKKVFITLNPSGDPASIQNFSVTIRDPYSAKILRYEEVSGSEFTLSSPKGEYLVEVEVPGYRSTNFTIELDGKATWYSIPMTKSIFPLSLQRLIGSREIEPAKLVSDGSSPNT